MSTESTRQWRVENPEAYEKSKKRCVQHAAVKRNKKQYDVGGFQVWRQRKNLTKEILSLHQRGKSISAIMLRLNVSESVVKEVIDSAVKTTSSPEVSFTPTIEG